MATIGSLAIKLSANAAQFINGVQKADRSLSLFTESIRKLLAVSGLFKTALVAVGGAALAAYGIHAIEATAATVKLARELWSTNDGFLALQLALRSIGEDSGLAYKALDHLNQTFGSVDASSDLAFYAMNRLGLSAQELGAMNTDVAFARIKDALSRVEDPATRAALAFQIFGEASKGMMATLSGGAASDIDSFARSIGLTIGELNGAELVETQIQLSKVADIIHGITIQFALELAPWILKAIDSLREMGFTGDSVGQMIASMFHGVAKGVAVLIDIWKFLDGVITLAVLGWEILAARFIQSVAHQFKTIAKLIPNFLPFGDVGKQLDDLIKHEEEYINELSRTGKVAEQQVKDAWNGGTVGKVDAFFDGVVNGANRAANAMNNLNRQTGGGSQQFAFRLQKLFEAGKRVFEEVMTPAQKFNLEMQKLNSLISVGFLEWDTYALAAGKAVNELERAHELASTKLPTLAERTTAASASAIIQSEHLNELRLKETPEQRVARVLEQSAEIERQQLEYMRRIAAALAQRPPEVRI